jgi:diguanylate cyclase (GGDEF)-like protein/PAS domain S-box-containing protein
VSLLSMALMLLAWAASQQLAAADSERDVQQRLRAAHAEVQASAQHLGEIAATVPGLLYQWFARPDGSRGFRYVSAHAQVLFGLAPERFGRLWWTRIHAEDRPMVRAAIRDAVAARLPWNVEGRVTDGAGQERWVRMMARPTSDGAEVVYTGFVIDITAERHGQAELQRLATTDSLTGLLTRRQFHLLGEREIARHERSGEPMAVLMLDVDHFKRVNDTHGHARGDAVLAAVALAMREALREVDVLGRFGGEEFVAVLVGADPATASVIAERLRVACGRVAVPLEGGGALSITVSIGLGAWCRGEDRLDAALRRADAALYRAKQGGRNRVEHAPASA